MAVTVVEVIHQTTVAAGPRTVTLAATPQPGDIVVVLYRCHRSSSVRAISSITGLGATWAAVAASTGGRMSVWKGTGATAAGNITITQTSAADMTVTVYLVRGTDGVFGTLQWANANGGPTLPATVTTSVGNGQVALGWIIGYDLTLASFTWVRTTPATGWVDQTEVYTGVYGIGATHRIPTGAATTHTTTLTSSATGDSIENALITLGSYVAVSDGSIAASPPAPQAALAATVTAPPSYTATIAASPPAPQASLAATVTAPSGPMEPGTHTVTVGGVDISCLVDSVAVTHGRDGPTGQPEASAVTIELTADAADNPLPPEVDVGAPVVVTTTTSTTVATRFTGLLTDMALGWDDAGPNTPDAGVGQLVAVSTLGSLGRRVVGDVPWPQELDGARVARVMAAAGITLDPLYSDPGTVELLARDVDSTAALSAAHDAATSADGVLWNTRAGEVRYADADHRRGITATLSLDACQLLVTPSWRRNLDGLINSVSVGYGVAPEGGEQPRFVETADASMATWGVYAYSTTTALATLADAEAVGRLLLSRNSEPVWVMAALPVDTPSLDSAEYDALLGLDVHSLIELTGLPSLGHAPTSATLWVEGWRERLTYLGHDIELVVSGYCRSVPPPRWDDADPDWTWDDGPGELTWDDMACLGGPPVNVGRWNDQPASLRWDQVDPDVTWDTYTGG